MSGLNAFVEDKFASRIRRFFRSRELFFHDGARMRRVHISAPVQATAASIATGALALSLLGTAHILGAVPSLAAAVSTDASVTRMQTEVATMQGELVSIRRQAAVHASSLEQRQAFLDAVLTGQATPAVPTDAAHMSPKAVAATAPLRAVEGKQRVMVGRATAFFQAQYRETASRLAKVGIPARRIVTGNTGMGGPYEPVDTTAVKGASDPQYRALFLSWKRLDQLQQGIVAIPSQKPVDSIDFTSGFGVRSDPFRGGAAMHAGVDIRGPLGTPIYATADGIIARAGTASGYGNLIEINHGRGIQTRYGHLSAILVRPGESIKRGALIGRMGSTGRSTGNHLHYEVRLDGAAVNPMPFLQGANYLASMQSRGSRQLAMGGPAEK